ncbi:aminotransferase class I/II-fold pyridoxal phosphate-dependent enzyme [Pseudidiomarina sp.]|uniref:trans-sulfuration enzyme family protein n=1 Tax=Pseudidiomarina sp. TaxID=2081707 RepID=UPI00299E98F2|nr:aminotransferase class I/II-fold pyridoxal phosphate-dependent enzyme [Pseudidiomarina sp.]MDX1704884.1 aminotransferase class I/II-fold pyridoxal phosphate-dependent enzyme [Pseudidiomarina sp.]
MSHKKYGYSPKTALAQALGKIDTESQGVVLPIHVATTYIRGKDNSYPSGNVYSRADNPTYKPVESLLCELEQGHEALLFGSGMAAATAVFLALAPGDHVLAPKVMYWSLRNWLLNFATNWGLKIELIDMTDVEALKQHLQPGRTKLVWLETPGNPLWTISDIAAISTLAHEAGAQVAVDSTCATPLLTQPLTLGADVVMHSCTKYLNGHSDVIAGALIGARDDAYWQRIRAVRAQGGAVPGPHDAAQLLRGMRTLHLRVRESCNTALFLAQQLEQHPAIAEVLYPGLVSFTGHEIAAKQMQGFFGGMLSVRIAGGEADAIHVAANTQLWKRATSLGGVESLIEHRASVEGPGSPCPADLLRLSVGIEDQHELLADLLQAMP